MSWWRVVILFFKQVYLLNNNHYESMVLYETIITFPSSNVMKTKSTYYENVKDKERIK